MNQGAVSWILLLLLLGPAATGQSWEAKEVISSLEKPEGAVLVQEQGGSPSLVITEAGADRISTFAFRNGAVEPAGKAACAGGPGRLVGLDLNSDRRTDLVVLCEDKEELKVLLNQGKGAFKESAVQKLGGEPAALATFKPTAKDPEEVLVLLARDGQAVERYSVRGGALKKVASIGLAGEGGAFATGDVNADGADDMVVLHPEEATYTLFLNDGKGNLVRGGTDSVTRDSDVKPRPIAVTMTDLDGDGAAEVAITAEVSCQLTIFKGAKGAKALEYVEYHAITLSGWLISSGDVDGDGKRDIVSGNLFSVESSIDLFGGDGAGKLKRVTNHVEKGDVRSVLVRDLDADGKAEVLAVIDDRAVLLRFKP